MYIHFSRITSPRKLSITRPLKPWMTSADLALEFKSQLDALESHISQFLPFARGALMTLAQQNGGPLTSTSESSNACNFVPPAYNISPKQHDVIKGLVLTVPAADILNDDWLGKSTSATTPSPRLKSEDYPSPCSKIDDVLDGDKMFEQAENGKEPVWKKIARSSLSGRESTGVFRMRRGSKPKSNWASKLQQGILNQDEAVSQWAAILDRTDSETIARNKQTSISNINFLGHNEERKVQTTITEDSNERPATTSASDVVLDLMGVSSFDLALEDGEIPNTVADLVVQSETLSRNRFERAFQSETIPRKRAERNRVSSTPSTMLSKRGATSISVDRPKTEERNITNQMESAVSNKEKRTLQRGKAAFYSLDRENQLDGVYQISGINISLLVGCTKVLLSVIMISQLYLIPFALGFDMILPEYYSVLVSVANFADCILELTVLNVDHVAMRSLKKPTLQDWRDFYVRHGFLIDIVTIIPFELLPIPNEQYLWVIRLMRLTKLPHLIHTAYKSFKTDKDPQTMSVMRQSNALIVPLFACFCIFLHLQACILFFAGRLRGFSNADISPLEDSPLINKYIWAVSIAIGNTFPMIYKPTDPSEQFLTFSFVILGAAFNASIVGVLSALAMGYDASGRLYKQKIDELQDYMRHKNLAPVTRRKILKYYDFKYRGKYFEESALLQDLNESLRMEIATHNCRELVRKVPFLFRLQNDGRDELFVSKIASALQACHYIAGDVVFVQGQMGDDMFFILRGSLHVIVGGKPVATLTEGSFFGEVALIANIPRTATVQVASSTILYRLTRNIFNDICDEFEDVKRRVHAIYLERMEKINLEEEARSRRVAKSLAANIEFLNRNEDDGRDEEFLLKLAKGLVVVFLVSGDEIFREGEPGDDMYFVKKGTVDILVNDMTVATINAGKFFGEVSLIANIPRTATAKATSTCMLYRLSRATFTKILDEFEDMRERIKRIYEERLAKVSLEKLNRSLTTK